MSLNAKVADAKGGTMKVRDARAILFRLTEFDDGVQWLVVEDTRTGYPGRTLLQLDSRKGISELEGQAAIQLLTEAATRMVHQVRHRQELLF